MKALEVKELSKSYAGRSILKNVSLELGHGEMCVVIGPSGAGKTTLLRILCGLERPDSGCIFIEGRQVEGERYEKPGKRGLGYVPQDSGLLPHLSARENVALVIRGKGADKRALEALEAVGMTKRANLAASKLSGGERQRVALARALALQPRVLLLDEPFSSLDAPTREELRDELRALIKRNRLSTLLVTHDRDEALSLPDSIAVLRDGTLWGPYDPEEIYTAPPSPEIGALLGPLNLLKGSFKGKGAFLSAGVAFLLSPSLNSEPSSESTVVFRPEALEVLPTYSRDAPIVVNQEVSYFGHDSLCRLYLAAGNGAQLEVLARFERRAPNLVGRKVMLKLDTSKGFSLK